MHRPFDRLVPDRSTNPPSPDGGGSAQAWFESMASLAWLLERRLAPLRRVGGKNHLACLRLRAIVALMWWERLLPQALSCWSVSDAERLVAATERRAEAMAFGRSDGGLSSLLVRGSALAVLDWIEAAGIKSGPVFRRITPDGRVAAGVLTPVGIAGMFSCLLMEGCKVGVVDQQFSLDFPQERPASPLSKPDYPPNGRDEGGCDHEGQGRLVALGGRVQVH